MMLPIELREAALGLPRIGAWEQMLPLLTVDESGYPHVCLLSRAELEVDGNRVLAVIASPTTAANLVRSGTATLVVIDADHATYIKLDVLYTLEDLGCLAVTFTLHAVKRDAAGVALMPARYEVAEHLVITESWRRTEALLDRLRLIEGCLV